ncbi:MAG: hypothetical protein ACKO5J_12465 [Rubrivivax sp.]
MPLSTPLHRRQVARAVALAAMVGSGLALSALAQSSAKPAEHIRQDIQRHRAMAAAHEGAARCLESGKPEAQCLKDLQAACKGLAIGKYCGMRHEH